AMLPPSRNLSHCWPCSCAEDCECSMPASDRCRAFPYPPRCVVHGPLSLVAFRVLLDAPLVFNPHSHPGASGSASVFQPILGHCIRLRNPARVLMVPVTVIAIWPQQSALS